MTKEAEKKRDEMASKYPGSIPTSNNGRIEAADLIEMGFDAGYEVGRKEARELIKWAKLIELWTLSLNLSEQNKDAVNAVKRWNKALAAWEGEDGE